MVYKMRMKFQGPISKLQINAKFQFLKPRKIKRFCLIFGFWSLFGIWVLNFGFWPRSYAAGEWGVTETNLNPHSMLTTLSQLTAITAQQKSIIDNLERQLIDCSYPKVSVTVADNFLGYAQEDIVKNELVRAFYSVSTIAKMLEESQQELAVLSNIKPNQKAKLRSIEVPRYITSPRSIKGTSFYATTQTISGKKEVRPVFFTGYGHFLQVQNDIEKFPGYGTNIIQFETGPMILFPSETSIDTSVVQGIRNVAGRAAANNLVFDLLLSPHYFPEWALNKYPELRSCSGGFLGFCIDAPESRKIISDYLHYLIPKINDLPALNSLCLSNEPIYVESRNCPHTKRLWKEYLKKTHRDIQTLNSRYTTQYQSFDEIPIPEPVFAATPLCYDWSQFNAERFTAWHTWMAGIIHELAPQIPVHAKIMVGRSVVNRLRVVEGVQSELFAQFSQINGNDDYKSYAPKDEYIIPWQRENMDYDFQCSVGDKPVFNSENHLIDDREFRYIPPVHIRNVLWQGAIHGQGATTIWVWERTFDSNHDFTGSIMHRPDCARMVGITNLDLQKFATEVTAINQVEPKYVILHSYSSLVYSPEYRPTCNKLYEVLNFSGMRVGFVTERQLAANKLSSDKILIIPDTPNLTDATYRGLQRFINQGGKIIGIAKDPKSIAMFNEYQQQRNASIKLWKSFKISLSKEELLDKLQSSFQELRKDSPIQVLDSQTGKPIIGIEYLSAKIGNHWVVNLSNYLKSDKTVIVTYNHQPMKCKNLFTDETSDKLTLPPLDPVLLQLNP